MRVFHLGSRGANVGRVLSLEQIGKSFGGVEVLAGVSLSIRGGEIHTVMGENGAGKSTLMKIIAGVHRPDTGRIVLNGSRVSFPTPQDALRAGITLIHQEPLSFPDLSVAENVLFAHGLPTTFPGRVDWAAMHGRVEALFASLGVSIDPRRRMRGMSVADQQMVELAAALAGEAKVLLMDEPTAALTPGEVDRLFRIVRKLKAEGVAIVFVSHRLPEVFDVSDQITVLRDGKFIATQDARKTTPQEIVRLMVGRELSALSQREAVPIGEVLLELDGVRRAGGASDVSLQVRAGEIVGLAGLVGAGRTELAEAVFGLRGLRGTVRVGGRAAGIRSPAQAIARGVAYVPEDRQHHGLLLPMSISQNASLADLSAVSTAGVLFASRERSLAEVWRERLRIRLKSVDQPVKQLSGGNQQKVVLAKWLTTNPRVLIVDEPTRGVDVGAKSEVHALLVEHARAGGAVLMISSDLPEVLAMSDRVLVMRGDAIVAEFAGSEATQEGIMAAATGTEASATLGGTRAEPSPGRGTDRPPPRGEVGNARGPLGEVGGEARASGLGGDSGGGHSADVRGTSPTGGAEGRAMHLPPRGRSVGAPTGRGLAPGARSSPGWISSLLNFRELGVLSFLLVATVIALAIEPRFRSVESFQKIALYIPLILVVAIGQMMVIVSRNIDLSVGSTLGLASIVACGMFVGHPGMSLWAAAGVAVGIGLIAGALNGVMVAYLRVPAIIATLATLTGYRGLIYIWSEGRQVDPDKLPESLLNLTSHHALGLPWIVWISGAVAVAGWAFLGHTVRGREIYAVGGNPEAALLRGIRVRRVTVQIFAICGALAGLAGLMFGSRFGTVNPNSVGVQMELVTISAVVIGGAAVAGGAGSVLGTLLGCLLLGVVNVAMIMLGVSELWQLVVYGSAILVACMLDAVSGRLTGRTA